MNSELYTLNPKLSTCPFRAFGTKTFQDVIDVMEGESVGEAYHGYVNLRKTEGAVTVGAIEMGVLVVNILSAVTVIRTDIIFQ